MNQLSTTQHVYQDLFFKHSGPESAHLLASSRAQFHLREYYRVTGVTPEAFAGTSLLETGCGPGSHSLILSNLVGPQGRLLSFDLSDVNIRKAEQMLATNHAPANYRFVVSSAEGFETSDDDFDFVFSHNWLHHSEDDVLSLFNILRPLKIGGLFYLCTYQSRTFRSLVCEMVRRHSLTFEHTPFLDLVPLCFPRGFAQHDFFQIIHYENIIDDYLVPNVRFAHLDTLLPAFQGWGLEPVMDGVSRLLLAPTLFDVEDIPLKVAFRKTRHFDDVGAFRSALEGSVFCPTNAPYLPAEAAHLPDLAERAYQALPSVERKMLLSLALHRLRCEFGVSSSNAAARFAALERLLQAVITGDHAAYSLHSGEEWRVKEHPLAQQIIDSTPHSSGGRAGV
jgi:SAM-dependent methyltransferase